MILLQLQRRPNAIRVYADPEWRLPDGLKEFGMDWLTAYGAAAVSLMMLFYALEGRSHLFVLAFAFACLASSAYGFLAGAAPFGIVEAVWTIVAVRRWRKATDEASSTATAR